MSYCRFIEGDVYAYDSCMGGVQFYIAENTGKKELDRLCSTYNEAYQYAKTLRDEHGLVVPNHAIDALREDALDETERFNGPSSAVADQRAENADLWAENAEMSERVIELESENAKLRTFITGYVLCNETHGSCIGAECPMHRQTDNYSKFDNWCSKYTLARELGIEVDR